MRGLGFKARGLGLGNPCHEEADFFFFFYKKWSNELGLGGLSWQFMGC
jgi:hypothetical protein